MAPARKPKVSSKAKVAFVLLAVAAIFWEIVHLSTFRSIYRRAQSSRSISKGTASGAAEGGGQLPEQATSEKTWECVERQGLSWQFDGTCACATLFSGPRCERGEIFSPHKEVRRRRVPTAFTGDIVLTRAALDHHPELLKATPPELLKDTPAHDPLREKVYHSCALVGDSGALLTTESGKFIDRHDMVMRFDSAPSGVFTDDGYVPLGHYVGSKTTFRLVSDCQQKHLTKGEVLLSVGDWRQRRLKLCLARRRASVDPSLSRFYTVNPAFMAYAQQTVRELSMSIPGEDESAEEEPSVELSGLLMALNMCHRVTLYGMAVSSVPAGVPRQYHNHSQWCPGPPQAIERPAWASEWGLFRRVADLGLARLETPCVSECWARPALCQACRGHHSHLYSTPAIAQMWSKLPERSWCGIPAAPPPAPEPESRGKQLWEIDDRPIFSAAKYTSESTPWKSVGQLKEEGVDLDGWVRDGPAAAAQVERRDDVKAAMKHAWDSYVRLAWGLDELMPVSGKGKNLFGGMGLTIIDSLDTLYIMGLLEEFEQAKGWIFENLDFDKYTREISVFETIIRYVGGFMSAYDLSGDRVFVDKCAHLAEKMMPAFNSPTGIPLNILNLRTGLASNPDWTARASSLAEIGTMQMEYVALSHHTGNATYARLAESIIKVLSESNTALVVPKRGRGLYPLLIRPDDALWLQPGKKVCRRPSCDGAPAGVQKITFGAMGDSFYEYLIKMWVQGGRTPALQKYRGMFDSAMLGMEELLIQQSDPSKFVYLTEYSADLQGTLDTMDHLTCFAPGMLVLGATGDRAEAYIALAQQLMYTCIHMYMMQPTRLAPELVRFPPMKDMVVARPMNLLRPETVESLMLLYRKTGDPIYREAGWMIFQAFEQYCRTPNGYSGLKDVTKVDPQKDDVMQSFFLAETLKYLYLLFDDTNHIPLDEWVFTTEAHPLKIFKRNSSYVD